MEAVVVTGQYRPQSLRNSVYKVKVISQEMIRLRGATDLTGILNTEAGVRFSTDYTLGESDISLMGMGSQRVKILLDGVPLVDRGETRQSLFQIDINTVERIEIVEGPMSVIYGTDALAGVINIITKKPSGKNVLSITARVQEETAGSSYHPFVFEGVHNGHLGLNWKDRSWQASASLSRNAFGGWSGNNVSRVKEWRPKDQYLGSALAGFSNGSFHLRYRLDYLYEDIYSAGALNPNNYRTKDQNYITNRFTHQLQSDWECSDRLTLSTQLSYQDYKRNTETYTKDFSTGVPVIVNSTDRGEWDVSKFRTLFLRSTALWKLSSMVTLQPGVEVTNDRTSGQRIQGAPEISNYSVFASAEIKPFNRLTLRPGLRTSRNSIYDAPPLIPSINLKWDVSPSAEVRFSYARGFRAPTLRELYFYFFDASHSIIGNPNLKAETSHSFNASATMKTLEKKQLRISSSASVFYNHFDDQIGLAGVNNVFTYINIDMHRTVGATTEHQFHANNFQASLAAIYVGRYNRYASDRVYKSLDLPSFTWSPEVTLNASYTFPRKWTTAVFYKYTGSLPAYETGIDASGAGTVFLTKRDGFHMADLTVTKAAGRFLTLQGGVRNLFDVVRIQSTSSGGAAHSSGGPVLTAFGRSYFAGISFQWSR